VIADIYLNGGNGVAPPGEPRIVTPQRTLLSDLSGSYSNEFGQMAVLRMERGQLLWQAAGRPAMPLTFRSEGTFDFDRREWRYYHALRGADGKVAAIEELNSRNRQAVLMRRIEPAQPTAAALAQLTGEYRLPELDTSYVFSVEGGVLIARTLWSTESVIFAPSSVDRFDSISGPWNISTLVVQRDQRGRPNGFVLHGGRVRNIALERVVGIEP
jgi:hypothetical protein